jgi:hypothetical protein
MSVPVHELSLDQAVLELDQVADQLMDADLPALDRRRLMDREHALEAWILMKQGHQTASPTPPPEESPVTLKGQTRTPESIAQGVATRARNKAAQASQLAPRAVPRAQKESAKPRSLPVEAEGQAPVSADEARRLARPFTRNPHDLILIPATEALATLQGAVLSVLQEAIRWAPEQRAEHLTAAANLDALAHQLANYLATGRIEVAA